MIFMIMREVRVRNQVGLHARPATYFVQKANEYKSGTWVEKDDKRINAKSLLGILSLGISSGVIIKIIADGPDEEDAIEGLCKLIEFGFADYL
jgi:phosphocarrier protein